MKTGLTKFIIVVSLLILSQTANAQSEPQSISESKSELKRIESRFEQNSQPVENNITLNQLLDLALQNNPAVKSSFYKWKSSLEKTGYAGAFPDPTVMYGYFIENVETRVGPQNQKFSLQQKIPWFGTLGSQKNAAFEMSQMSLKNFQSQSLQLIYQVKTAYYDLYYLEREIEITQENIDLLMFWESIVRKKYQVNLVQHPDVIKAQVELGELENKLLSLQDKRHPYKAKLLALVNLDSLENLEIPDSLEFQEDAVDNKILIPKILENNPNLTAVKHLIASEQASVEVAQKSTMPSFTLGIDYIETGEALNPTMDGSGKDPLIVSVGLNLPLWFGKNKAKKNEALANQKSAEYLLQDRKNQLTALADETIFNHNDALRKLQLYRDGLIPKAEQLLNTVYASYQSGKTDFLNLLDAQRQLLKFKLAMDQSITNMVKRKAELDMLAGVDLTK